MEKINNPSRNEILFMVSCALVGAMVMQATARNMEVKNFHEGEISALEQVLKFIKGESKHV